MGSIHEFQFSLTTLLFFFVLPFAYYGYSSAYWYLPDRTKSLDLLLSAVSIVLSLLVLVRLSDCIRSGEYDQLKLIFLHLAPPLLALLAVVKGRKTGFASLVQSLSGGQKDPALDFSPAGKGEIEAVGWDELIINDAVKQELNSVIDFLKNPKKAKKFGIKVPKGILLNGPPGTGKTTIAKAVANTAGLSFFALRPDEIVSKWVGESEKNLTRLFKTALGRAPSVIFIDEIDSLGKKRSDQNATYADNLLNHLLQLIDGVIKAEGVYIIAATNRADLVDEALKRAGRLNRVIEIPLPDREARKKMFQLYLSKAHVAGELDIDALAEATEDNSGADIKEICNQAGLHAYQRSSSHPGGQRERDFGITSADIEAALEEFAVEEKDDSDFDDQKRKKAPGPVNEKIEEVSWDDLIIAGDLKQELQSIIQLLKDPATAKRYGIDVPKGILLNGPPGTGKTTLAKVIASTANLAFFVLQTNEVISKWVGESEKNLTRLFKSAMRHAPSVIFIDEIDSIGKNRAEGNAQHADSLLNHLLQLIDGVIKTEGIYIIAATNRADLVDPALKRGGRLNRVIEVPLPDFEARKLLFDLYLSKLSIVGRLNFDQLAKATENKSAADIKQICNQAGLNAFKRESAGGSRDYIVTPEDLMRALKDFTGG